MTPARKPKDDKPPTQSPTVLPGSTLPLADLLKALAGKNMDYAPVIQKYPALTPQKIRQGLRLAVERLQEIGAHKLLVTPTKGDAALEPSLPSGGSGGVNEDLESVGMGRMIPGPRWQTFVDLGLKVSRSVENLDPLVANIDGCSKGNPGPAGVGVVFSMPDGDTLAEGCAPLGRMTNNAAEYHALIAALAQALKWGAKRVEIRTDSELLARQMDGSYQVKSPLLFPLVKKAQELRRKLAFCKIQHVPREDNQRADRLANLALERTARGARR